MSETHGKCTENARETHNALHEWREYVRHAESGHNYATMSGLIERAERAIAHFRDRAEQAEAALSAEREKKCLACRWWNPARFDDWGCCQNPDVDMGKKFTPTYPARFGCALFERRQP